MDDIHILAYCTDFKAKNITFFSKIIIKQKGSIIVMLVLIKNSSKLNFLHFLTSENLTISSAFLNHNREDYFEMLFRDFLFGIFSLKYLRNEKGRKLKCT